MLFHVEMTVKLPPEMPAKARAVIKEQEKHYAQELQRQGKWRHLWCVFGSYVNVSFLDIHENGELQEIISDL